MKKDAQKEYPSFWRGMTLQLFAMIILPLTLLLVIIAIGSVAIHQHAMRELLPEETWKMATSPALELTLIAPLVLVPPLVLSIFALWFGARQIVRPLQQLESRAAALARGDFRSIEEPVSGIPEIHHLQEELIQMARKVQAAQESLHDYIGAITTGQEEERRRLARELHDETLQSLIALRQRVQLARMKAKDDEIRQSLADLERISSETVDELRRLARALRPVYLEDLGLVTALEMLARETGAGSELTVRFERKGVERRLDPALELALYRIVQEALSNVTRHAGASQASVCVTFQAENVVVEITDNGRGFTPPRSPAEFASDGHFGLLGMHERAELVGAKLTIVSTLGARTTITVRV
ncbi:MAG: histidine kinase [Chloroflexota bacterium]